MASFASPAHADPAVNTVAVGGSDTTEQVLGSYLSTLPGCGAAAWAGCLATWKRTQTATAGTNIPAQPGVNGFNVTTDGCAFDANADGVVKWGNATNNQEHLAPNGSSAGITELVNEAGAAQNCLDAARSSRGPRATDNANLRFHQFALDAVWPVTQGMGDAGVVLDIHKVRKLFLGADEINNPAAPDCITNWNDPAIGGQNVPVVPFLPQAGSGSRNEFFARWLNIADPGSGAGLMECVPAANQTGEENNGRASNMISGASLPGAIVAYSMGKWVRQGNNAANAVVDLRNGFRPLTINEPACVAQPLMQPLVRSGGSWALNSAIVTTANADTNACEGVRHLWNVTDTASPQFADAEDLVGRDGPHGVSGICQGTAGASAGLIRSFGFIPETCGTVTP